MTAPPDGAPPLESVHRALRLVVALRSRGMITVTEAAEMLGVVPSTAHRLLAALCYDGFAVRDEDRQYRVGPAAHGDVPPPPSMARLRDAARGPMEDLSRTVDETVQLWVRQGTRVRFVDGVEGSQPLSVRSNVWDDSPAVASAAGRAMLAEAPRSEIESTYAQDLPDWGKSRITTVPELEVLLEEIRRDGYAVSIEESVAGVNGVAASLHAPGNVSVAAISIAIPTVRFGEEKVRACATALRATVRAVERTLVGQSG